MYKKSCLAILCLILFPYIAFATTGGVVALGIATAVGAGSLIGIMLALPAAAPYIAGAALLGMVAGSNVYMGSQSSSTSGYTPSVSSNADITKPTDAVWIDLNNSQFTVETQKEQVKITAAALQALAAETNSDGSNKYPLTYAALYTTPSLPKPDTGTILQLPNGNKYVMTQYSNSCVNGSPNCPTGSNNNANACGWAPDAGATQISGGVEVFRYPSQYIYASQPNTNSGCSGTYNYLVNYTLTATSSTVSTPTPKPLSTQLTNLTGTGSAGALQSQFNSEIDNMLKDPNYVPNFTDASTGLPYAPPAGALSLSQMQTQSPADVQAQQTAQAGVTAAAANVSNAQGRVTSATAGQASAQTTANNATAAANADPTNTAKATAAQNANIALGLANLQLQQAQSALDAANGALSKANTTAGLISASNTDKSTDAPASTGTAGTAHTINLAPLNNLKGVLTSTFPFSLAPSIAGYYSALIASPSPPVFTIPFPLGFNMTVDLTPFDGIATICRWLVSILMTVGAIYYVIHFWRGVS